MRTQTNESECFVIRQLVQKHQIRFQVAIPKIPFISGQKVITKIGSKGFVGDQVRNDRQENCLKAGSVFLFCLSLEIALELRSLLNGSHGLPP